MSLIPCRRCGQPLGEEEPFCGACGLPRGAAPPALDSEKVPPSGSSARSAAGARAVGAFAGLALAAFAAYAGWSRLSAGSTPAAAAPAAAPAPSAAAGPSASPPPPAALSAPAPAPAAVAASTAAAPDQEEAELPPAPTGSNPNALVIYGVVYDLATKKPVPKTDVIFSRGGQLALAQAQTDAHGWYRADIPKGSAPQYLSARASRDDYAGALQERDPPLASRTAAQRRAAAEEIVESDKPIKPIGFDVETQVSLAELDLALVPRVWPAGMPPAQFADAGDPPEPDLPSDVICRYYGVAYDLATKKPIRRAALEARWGNFRIRATTDGKGRYQLDLPVSALDSSPAVSAEWPGYRTGLLAERDPALRLLSEKTRRDVADTVDLGFDPVELPNDCEEGLIRFDVVAVPRKWPAR